MRDTVLQMNRDRSLVNPFIFVLRLAVRLFSLHAGGNSEQVRLVDYVIAHATHAVLPHTLRPAKHETENVN
jgi:hypothetical protein